LKSQKRERKKKKPRNGQKRTEKKGRSQTTNKGRKEDIRKVSQALENFDFEEKHRRETNLDWKMSRLF